MHRHPPTFLPGNTYTSLKNAPYLEIPEVLNVESFDVYLQSWQRVPGCNYRNVRTPGSCNPETRRSAIKCTNELSWCHGTALRVEKSKLAVPPPSHSFLVDKGRALPLSCRRRSYCLLLCMISLLHRAFEPFKRASDAQRSMVSSKARWLPGTWWLLRSTCFSCCC